MSIVTTRMIMGTHIKTIWSVKEHSSRPRCTVVRWIRPLKRKVALKRFKGPL